MRSFLIIILLFVVSCQKNADDCIGDLQVIVINDDEIKLPNVDVSIPSLNLQSTTDNYGSVLFRDLKPDNYLVKAKKDDIETESSVNIQEQSLSSLDLTLSIVIEEELEEEPSDEPQPIAASPVFNFLPSDMLVHGTKVYLFDTDYIYNDLDGVYSYDYYTGEILFTNFLDDIGFATIGDTGFGTELYVPCQNGKIYILNPDDLTTIETINNGLENKCVQIQNDFLIVTLDPAPNPWWIDPIRTYSRATGEQIDGGGTIPYERLKKNPTNGSFISITSKVTSPRNLKYYEFNNDGEILVDIEDDYHGDYPLNDIIFSFSPDGEYVITAPNGTFYDANTLTYEYELAPYNIYNEMTYSSFVSGENGEIYASLIDEKKIEMLDYASSSFMDEIITTGLPCFIYKQDDLMITFSMNEPDDYSGYGFIEVIKL